MAMTPSWAEQVEGYINRKIRNGEDVRLTTEDGDVLLLTKETAEKAGHAFKPDGSRMTKKEYETKLNAETHIDELAAISKKGKTKEDYDARHGDFASKGWNYRTALFKDFDGSYYRVRISVAQSERGNVVYNVGEVEKRSTPSVNGSSAQKGGTLKAGSTSADSISNVY